jgi:guanylate kinase
MAYTGTFALIVGSSGSGKGVLLKHAKAAHPEIVFPVSCTTRAMRPGEKDGETYHFISDEEFMRQAIAGDFLEWAEYGGSKYGTLKSEIIVPLEEGKLVMREVDVQGVRQLRGTIPPENLVTIYIHAGAWADVERRIRGRAPISEAELELRKHRYEDEHPFINEADYVVENFDGKFKEADAAFEAIIQKLLPSA